MKTLNNLTCTVRSCLRASSLWSFVGSICLTAVHQLGFLNVGLSQHEEKRKSVMTVLK
jgi:hypothetical protein